MKYYFEIQTLKTEFSGTKSDFAVQLFGEKGESNVFNLFDVIGKKEIKTGEKLNFEVESNVDVGCVNKIKLTKDKQIRLLNGWGIDYIKVGKNPISLEGQISVFQVNSSIENWGESKTYEVTSGYPYSVKSTTYHFEQESEGSVYVPAGVHYSKQITTDLNIIVNKSTMKTKDISSGASINLSESAINTAFDKRINNTINETLDISVNTMIQCTDTIDIEGGAEPICYDIMWQKKICTMVVQMGEIEVSFEVPKNKSFAGLIERRPNKSGAVNKQEKYPLFDTLALAITRKCNAECDMCCFECGPEKTEELEDDLLFRIIEEAAAIDSIKKIGFTGGEATLRPKVLIECIKRAKGYGMQTSLVSNGIWAKDLESAREWLLKFKNAGLDSLAVSIDEYHKKYVPLDFIRNIIQANRTVGIYFKLSVGDSLGKRNAVSIIKELHEDAYEIPFIMYPFVPVGRGKELDNTLRMKIDGSCTCHNHRILSILYDGSVYPCCSQAVYGSLLSEKNIRDASLKEIMEHYEYFSVFSAMTHHDFKWLLDKAKEYGIEVKEEYHSLCSLCNELFTNKKYVEKLKQDIAKEYAKLLLEGAGKMSDMLEAKKIIDIGGKRYDVNVIASVGNNPTSLKITPTGKLDKYVLYTIKADSAAYESHILDTIVNTLKTKSEYFNNFPQKMPKTMVCGTFRLTRKASKG